MGNCQTTDIAAIVVDYPGGRVEKFFLTVPARQLMTSNPGYFVAITAVPHLPVSSATEPAKPIFKLLPADAPLCVGYRYRLISFEEVFTYFSQGGIDSVAVKRERPQKLQGSTTPRRQRAHDFIYKLPKQQQLHKSRVVDIGCSHSITKLRL